MFELYLRIFWFHHRLPQCPAVMILLTKPFVFSTPTWHFSPVSSCVRLQWNTRCRDHDCTGFSVCLNHRMHNSCHHQQKRSIWIQRDSSCRWVKTSMSNRCYHWFCSQLAYSLLVWFSNAVPVVRYTGFYDSIITCSKFFQYIIKDHSSTLTLQLKSYWMLFLLQIMKPSKRLVGTVYTNKGGIGNKSIFHPIRDPSYQISPENMKNETEEKQSRKCHRNHKMW